MIIPRTKELSEKQMAEISEIVSEFRCSIQPIVGATRTIYAILGDEREELMINRIEGLEYVSRVDSIQSPYKLMDKKSDLASHQIRLGDCLVKEELLVIAGQCTIDPRNPQYFIETAHAVKEAGANVLRGGVWKPRTSPHSYQGSHKALETILEASRQTGLPINIEVMEEEHLHLALEAKVDMLQVGARNALNYSLLKKIGTLTANHYNMPILLKRSIHMGPLDEFICAAEYIVSRGNPNVFLCPRGTMPNIEGYRNYPDECITPLLKEKTWAPVIVDPSHSVGKAIYVHHAALAAVAYGADGLSIETHIDPLHGIGDDPKQAVLPKQLAVIIEGCKEIFKRHQNYLHHP